MKRKIASITSETFEKSRVYAPESAGYGSAIASSPKGIT